jgi:hypothetical protein
LPYMDETPPEIKWDEISCRRAGFYDEQETLIIDSDSDSTLPPSDDTTVQTAPLTQSDAEAMEALGKVDAMNLSDKTAGKKRPLNPFFYVDEDQEELDREAAKFSLSTDVGYVRMKLMQLEGTVQNLKSTVDSLALEVAEVKKYMYRHGGQIEAMKNELSRCGGTAAACYAWMRASQTHGRIMKYNPSTKSFY